MTWKMLCGSVAAVGLVMAAAGAKAQAGQDVMTALHDGGFSAPMDKTGSLAPIGSMECGQHMIDVLFYSNSSPSTRSRVVFLDGATYLGSYPVDDKPKVEKKELKFHYKGRLGKTLMCEKDGKLPASFQLDGDILIFEK